MRDVASQQPFTFFFTTRKDTGLPTTLSGTPVLSVYKDGGLTQTTVGPTLTVDFDGVTGSNKVAMAITDAFYVDGSDYSIEISAGTVNAISVVGEVVGEFSIEKTGGALALLKHVSYGLAQLVRSTTPANTLTVDANNRAEVLLGAVTHTGATVPTVGTVTSLAADQSGVTIGTVNNVSGLVSGTGGISVAAESFTLTVGGTPTNTFADTRAKDGTHHIVPPSAGNTDAYYTFDVTNAGVPQTVTWIGYVQSNGDSYTIHAYNYALAVYEQIDLLSGSNGTTETIHTFDLLIDHVGTGADAGKVRLRFLSALGTNFATDRIFCTFTQATTGIVNGSTITLLVAATNQNFVGFAWNMILNGQTISGSLISGSVDVSGTGVIANGNPAIIQRDTLNLITLSAFFIMESCAIANTLTLTSTTGVTADSVSMFRCVSGVPGDGAPTIDASGVTKTTAIQSRLYGGGVIYILNSFCTLSHEVLAGGTITLTNAGGAAEIRGLAEAIILTSSGTATTHIVVVAGTPITVNGTGGTVDIYGMHGAIIDNSAGSVTINDFGANVLDVPAILADTNELQTNQGNWFPATGFSTHTAADVWAVGTRAITNNNDKTGYGLSAAAVDAIWDELQSGHTTVGTFGKFLDVEVSSVSGGGGLTSQDVRDAMKLAPTAGTPSAGSVDEHLDDILTDTNDLQTNQGSWATATGFATGTALATAQLDLDKITGADGVTLATAQGNYAPNKVVPDVAGFLPTAVENRQEMDTSSTQLTSIKVVTDAQARAAATIVDGAAVSGTLSTIAMTTDITVTVADQFNGRQLVFAKDTTTVALRGQATAITATTVTGSKLGFTALTTAPVVGDVFSVV